MIITESRKNLTYDSPRVQLFLDKLYKFRTRVALDAEGKKNIENTKYLDAGQVRVLKNSIYARHGRRFQDSQLRSYFNSQSWYRPTRNEVPAREFNKYENYNITFLHKYE